MSGPAPYDPDARERITVAYDAHLARRLWGYVRPERGWILVSLLLLLATSAAALGSTWVIKIAIDEYVAPGVHTGIAAVLGLLLALSAVEVVGRAVQTWTVDRAGQNALLRLRMDVFGHLQRLSASFYDRTPTGKLIGRVTTDIEALQEMFSSGVVTILGDFVFITATVAILFNMNWRLAALVMLVVPVLLGVTTWIRTRVRAIYSRMVSSRSRLNAWLHEHVVGMPLVQSFVREDLARAGFGQRNGEMRDAQLEGVLWETLLSSVTELLGSLTMALILWYGGGLILGTEPGAGPGGVLAEGMTLGALFAFIDYMRKFFVPLNELSLKYTVMQNAMTASDRIFALLDIDEFTEERPGAVAPPPRGVRGEIVFEQVTFGYSPDEPVLDGLDFRISAGERVAIVGATGAGKTTILKLITRLYDVQQGAIRLDGVDVRDLPLKELRQRVGIVPQDVFLFGGDVLENVRLGHPEVDEADAIAAADRLHLDQIVARFPRGYREPVRERGANLSSGERQLVAFARVLAVAPEVLALDEATSNVDTRTEHLLQEAVHELIQGRTALIIAHRLSTIRDVDRILVMSKGRLVEQGTHDELLALRGVYWRLYQLQYQETSEGVA